MASLTEPLIRTLVAEGVNEALAIANDNIETARESDIDDPKMLVYLKMTLAAARCALEIYVQRQTSRLSEKEKA